VRVRRSLATVLLVAVALGVGTLTARASTSGAANLGADGIGSVRFGLPKAEAVDELRAEFGPPTWRGINTACGPNWTEVTWDDLAAEFRLGKFCGYRYASARQIQSEFGSPKTPTRPGYPKLVTTKGITLERTLAALRAAYILHLAGAGRWHSNNGLIFVSNARHGPAPLSSRIREIKTSGACGDF
jgi:hypothetical protein